jgi:hypothetical protein
MNDRITEVILNSLTKLSGVLNLITNGIYKLLMNNRKYIYISYTRSTQSIFGAALTEIIHASPTIYTEKNDLLALTVYFFLYRKNLFCNI